MAKKPRTRGHSFSYQPAINTELYLYKPLPSSIPITNLIPTTNTPNITHQSNLYTPTNHSITMSFSRTSTNITLSGSVLSADCGDANGNFHASSIDLNNVLGNVNGNSAPGGSGWFNTATT